MLSLQKCGNQLGNFVKTFKDKNQLDKIYNHKEHLFQIKQTSLNNSHSSSSRKHLNN